MKEDKSLSDLYIEMATYQGEDRVITSSEMQDIIRMMPELKPFYSSIPSLDTACKGFCEGELIAISGPRKAGKTLFSQSLTVEFFNQDIKSLWFSFELPAREFIARFPGNLPAFVMPLKLKQNSLEWIKLRIIEGIVKHGIRVVFIDHLHFLFDLARMRNSSIEIGQVIRTLKTMAIDLNITIFLMCHMAKLNPYEEPSDNNIRDSSFVSQESDVGILIWRDVKTESEAYAKVCYHRRTGVIEKKIALIKVDGLLKERKF